MTLPTSPRTPRKSHIFRVTHHKVLHVTHHKRQWAHNTVGSSERLSCPRRNRNPQARRLISVHLLPRATRPRLLLRAAVALLAVLALTLVAVLSGCGAGTAATSETVPPYYAETVAIQPPAYDSPLNVSIRVTATGDESAALRALPPYQSIGFVAGTGKPNWWIVGAQRWHPVNYDNSAPRPSCTWRPWSPPWPTASRSTSTC